MRVAVTGATGFVGQRLVPALTAAGHEVRALTRDAARGRAILGEAVDVCGVDPRDPDVLREALAGQDGVVNLQGENLFARRWRRRVRADILASRIETTRALVEAMGALEPRPRVLVAASAVGIFGARPADEILDETTPAREGAVDSDFLVRVCTEWEAAASGAEALGTRVVHLRIGAVLGRGGGALAAMERPYRFFVGGPIGRGRQMVSWIHEHDLRRMILFALEDERVHGALNATAPNPVSNREIGKALGRAMGRPSWLPAPRPLVRLALGGVATLVTTGQRVVPRRALDLGFAFAFPTVDEALADLYCEGEP